MKRDKTLSNLRVQIRTLRRQQVKWRKQNVKKDKYITDLRGALKQERRRPRVDRDLQAEVTDLKFLLGVAENTISALTNNKVPVLMVRSLLKTGKIGTRSR